MIAKTNKTQPLTFFTAAPEGFLLLGGEYIDKNPARANLSPGILSHSITRQACRPCFTEGTGTLKSSKQGSRFSVSRKGGKYLTTFYDPDLISVKSYEPRGGLKNIKLDYLDKQMEEWLTKMNPSVLEKKNIRIKQTAQGRRGQTKEVHLVMLGEDDASQFKDKIQGIAQLANRKGFTIRVIQFMRSTGTFISLL